MTTPLFSLPDGTPVAVDDLQEHWGSLRYRGNDLIDTYLRYDPPGVDEGQEVYLGYVPESDAFIVGYDGDPSAACLIVIGDDGSVLTLDAWHDDDLFYRGLYEEMHHDFDLVDLRLD